MSMLILCFSYGPTVCVSFMHKANYIMLHRLNLPATSLTFMGYARVHGYAVCMLCSCVIKGALFLMGANTTCSCSIV